MIWPLMDLDLNKGREEDLCVADDWSWAPQFASVIAWRGSVWNWLKALRRVVILLLKTIPRLDVFLTYLMA